MSARLLREQRLRSARAFTAAVRQGQFCRGTLLNLWAVSRAKAQLSGGPACLGLLVSRKVDLLAVKRNLWKRRIREAFRKNQAQIAPGWALVVQARKRTPIPAYREIEKEFLQLCQAAKVMRSSETKPVS